MSVWVAILNKKFPWNKYQHYTDVFVWYKAECFKKKIADTAL